MALETTRPISLSTSRHARNNAVSTSRLGSGYFSADSIRCCRRSERGSDWRIWHCQARTAASRNFDMTGRKSLRFAAVLLGVPLVVAILQTLRRTRALSTFHLRRSRSEPRRTSPRKPTFVAVPTSMRSLGRESRSAPHGYESGPLIATGRRCTMSKPLRVPAGS